MIWVSVNKTERLSETRGSIIWFESQWTWMDVYL